MLVAHFIGSHTKDTPGVRLGWWLTRLVQKGKYKEVTHCEAILAEHEDGSVTIGSSSVRDWGVRIKRCHLAPGNWLIADVPQWDRIEAAVWFAYHNGDPYDWRGAFASCMPFSWSEGSEWFCNEAVGDSVRLASPEIFGPAQFASVCFSVGVDVTEEFFQSRKQ